MTPSPIIKDLNSTVILTLQEDPLKFQTIPSHSD